MTNPNTGEDIFAELNAAFKTFREELEKEFSEIFGRAKVESSEDAPEEDNRKGVTWEELSDWFDEHDAERINPLGDLDISKVSAGDVKDSAEAWKKQQEDYVMKLWDREVVPIFADSKVVSRKTWEDHVFDNLKIDGKSYWQLETREDRHNFLTVVDSFLDLASSSEWGVLAKTCEDVWEEIDKMKSRPYYFHCHFEGRVSISEISTLIQRLKNLRKVA